MYWLMSAVIASPYFSRAPRTLAINAAQSRKLFLDITREQSGKAGEKKIFKKEKRKINGKTETQPNSAGSRKDAHLKFVKMMRISRELSNEKKKT